MDEDGYPDEAELEQIAQWSSDDHRGLLGFVRDRWRYGSWGWEEAVIDEGAFGPSWQYRMSTGGWSGNESLIEALQKNRMFWMFCWWSSRRGGHYEFRIRLPKE